MTGVSRDWLVPENFVMIHFDLIDQGLSLEAALLLHRIYFRSNLGDGWWLATKAEMQVDTRLSERKLDRAVTELRDAGMVEWRRKDAQNPTLAWRLVWADGEGRKRPSGEGQNVPQQEDETSLSSTKNVKNNPSPSADGGVSADGLSTEADLFGDFWAHYPKKVARKDAEAAFEKALKRADYLTIRAGLVSAIKAWRTDGKVTTEQDGDVWRIKVVAGEAGKGVPHAASWLNGDRWADEYPAAQATGSNGEEQGSWMHRTG